MKYFTHQLISAANDWVEQSEQESRLAQQRLRSNIERYHRQLDVLKPRISGKAWKFFRHGFGETGLHDARLLLLSIGDGLDYSPTGASPFFLNRQHTSAQLQFLNYDQSRHYVFELRRVNHVRADLFIQAESSAKSLGDLYAYELTAPDEANLQLGLLFASGASLAIQFQRLVFGSRRIKREYELGEMYR